MKHKIKVQVPVEKRGFLGIKKTVMETRTVDECRKTGRRSEKILKLLGEMQNDKN